MQQSEYLYSVTSNLQYNTFYYLCLTFILNKQWFIRTFFLRHNKFVLTAGSRGRGGDARRRLPGRLPRRTGPGVVRATAYAGPSIVPAEAAALDIGSGIQLLYREMCNGWINMIRSKIISCIKYV